MTSKLDNKAGAKQVISGCEFFMAEPLSKVGKETGAFCWGIGLSLDLTEQRVPDPAEVIQNRNRNSHKSF